MSLTSALQRSNSTGSGRVPCSPVIDRTYALDEVPDAIRYLEQGHAREDVVITMPDRAGPA